MRECSLIYKLGGLNLPSQWPYLRYSVFTFLSSRRRWISKFKKSDKLTCTESLMIKLSTAILLLVGVESSVWSANLISEKYSSFYLFHIFLHSTKANAVHNLGCPAFSKVTFYEIFRRPFSFSAPVWMTPSVILHMRKDYRAPHAFCSCLSKSEHSKADISKLPCGSHNSLRIVICKADIFVVIGASLIIVKRVTKV